MKTYKERTESVLRKTKEKQRRKKRIKASAIAACALAVILTAGYVFFPPLNGKKSKIEQGEYGKIIREIKRLQAIGETFDPVDDSVEEGDSAEISPGESSGEYVETTDNQVNGVIEGDLLKRTETHAFYLDYINRGIKVYSIEGKSSQLVHMQPLPEVEGNFYGGEIYLSADGDRLTVLNPFSWEKDGVWKRYTRALSYDVSNPISPILVGENYLSGNYLSSRMTEHGLLLFNHFYVNWNCDFDDEFSFLPHYGSLENMQPIAGEDIVCPDEATNQQYTVICLLNEENGAIQDCAALFSYAGSIYVSRENIFATRAYTDRELDDESMRERSMTEIARITYGEEGLIYESSAAVAGSVKNQYSMDEYEGVLRVVTTTRERCYTQKTYGYADGERTFWSMTSSATAGSLYCLDVRDMKKVASAENFAAGETVESVRFDGEKAHVCTATVITFTDPVFTFDLSNLEEITYVDTGVIEGYSTSLVNFKDGFLLGIGYGENSSVLKIEIYVEQTDKVVSVCAFEKYCDFSVEYKSYYINREQGLIGLAMYDYEEGKTIYRLFAFDGYQLVPVIEREMRTSWLGFVRATMIDGDFYIFGGADDFYVIER